MKSPFLQEIRLQGFLSFAPGSPAFEMRPLNVLIGPNASGKSNLLEAIGLLEAAPHDLAGAVRRGGGAPEWLWKGAPPARQAEVEAIIGPFPGSGRPLRYRLALGSEKRGRVEVLDEAVEERESRTGEADPYFYYRFQQGRPALNVSESHGEGRVRRNLRREDLAPDQSVLQQRQDPDAYPEVTWLGGQFRRIAIYRDWVFGAGAPLRAAQRTDWPGDRLTPDAENLALVVNHVEHECPGRLNELLRRFCPRFERVSTRVSGGLAECWFHESGMTAPIPATRVSDGTIRFVAVLATLLAPSAPSVLGLEEPELGLHPDAAAAFAEVLVETSERTQVVVTTHSEALVAALSGHPEALVVCERREDTTSLRRLEPGEVEEWMDEYTVGDLWRMGQLGGNP